MVFSRKNLGNKSKINMGVCKWGCGLGLLRRACGTGVQVVLHLGWVQREREGEGEGGSWVGVNALIHTSSSALGT